jgi:hypothetical protein
MTTNIETAASGQFASDHISYLKNELAKAEAKLEGAIARDEASYQCRLANHDFSSPWWPPKRSDFLEQAALDDIRRAKEALERGILWQQRWTKNA